MLNRTLIIPLAITVLILTPVLATQIAPAKSPVVIPPVKTPVTVQDLHIAERAADILDLPEKWNHNDTGDCPVGAKSFSLYCALDKASQEVSGREDDRSAVMQEGRVTADFMARKRLGDSLVNYNNDSATTFQDAQEFFRILRTRLARRMDIQADDVAFAARGEGIARSRPPVTDADVQIVRHAQDILNSPAKWNRADNRTCPRDAKTFSLYCALEKATQEVSGNFEHRGAAMQEARFVIEDIAPNAPYYDHRLMDFNNDPATTFFDVQKFFQLLQERVSRGTAAQNSH